ncbi:cyclase family protein [Rhodopila sp.]|uniref:cyclase family protein n=1 Tax=Rhodopila sp. TaxID=2480087 RepID=UPI003D0B5260
MPNLIHSHSQWGPTDQVGAGNLLTVEKRIAALTSVRQGRIYDVSHEIFMGAPYMAPNQTPFLMSIFGSWRDTIKRRRKLGATNDAGTNLERIEMTTHVGTHIDALGHFSNGDRLYNNNAAADVVTDWGLDRLGIEHVPPMITRGLLFDVAGAAGSAHLSAGQTVTPDHLKRAADAGGFAVEPGDIALIRTGWGRYYGTDNARYLEGEPGLDVPAAKWLIDQGIAAIGADTMAVEVLPNPDRGLMMPVHRFALAECGVYLIENLALEELAAGRVHAGCFILLATKFRGATGAPVRPVVMV